MKGRFAFDRTEDLQRDDGQPVDLVARFFVEQWVTFPRFVLSGKFAAAWREAK